MAFWRLSKQEQGQTAAKKSRGSSGILMVIIPSTEVMNKCEAQKFL
jgi:hypothetical protein